MLQRSGLVKKTVVAMALAMAAARAAEAGPPLICHPFDAGKAQLLPWAGGQNWKAPDPSYEVSRLTADVTRLLTADAPILARMENLRRATIYAAKDRAVATELMRSVLGRASSAPRDALAQFDAGYLIETYRQAGAIDGWQMLPTVERAVASQGRTLDGYGYVVKALELAERNPEMEYAASLMKTGAVADEHRRRALAGAPAGSLLAKNLTAQ